MDKRAKVTIFVGIGIFLVGIIGMVIGAVGVSGVDELTKFKLDDVSNGTIEIVDSDGLGDLGMTFWVKGEYLDADENGIWDHCDRIDINVTERPNLADWSSYDGEFYYEVLYPDKGDTSGCEAEIRNQNFDREGYVKIGRACNGCFAGTFSFESSENVSVTYDDELIEDLGGTIGLIILGFLGGTGALCCGVVIITVGIILIFTLKDDAPVTMSIGPDGSYVMDASPQGAIGVGVSQNISQVTSTAVVTEQMTKAEPYQFPSTDEAEQPSSPPTESETKVEPFEFKPE